MPLVDIIGRITEMKSSNWIAQESRSQAANGKKLEICNLQDMATLQLHYHNLLMSVIEQLVSN